MEGDDAAAGDSLAPIAGGTGSRGSLVAFTAWPNPLKTRCFTF